MAYIGSIPAYQASGVRPRDEFTCDGTQICFALSQTVPGSFESSVTVVLDNVPQQPVEAFTVVDTKTLTFSAVTGTFTVNETVTGGTSTATGTVLKVNLGSIVVRQITGTFTNSETVTGGTSSASATNSAVDTNSGGGILFSEAPAASAILYVVHEGNATYDLIPSAASVGPNQLTDNLKNFTVDTFTGDNSTVAFTLSATPASANSILVMVDGVVQTRTTNYTLAGAVITFTGTPDTGAAITVIHLGFSTTSRTGLVDGSVTPAKLSSGGLYWNTSSNVGIGTTSPSTLLHVAKSQNTETGLLVDNQSTGTAGYGVLRLANSVAGGGSGFALFGSGYTTSGIFRSSGGYIYSQSNASGGLTLNTEGAYPLYFGTNSTERMRIDSVGQVGIGATPVTWGSSKALQIGLAGAFSGQTGAKTAEMTSNAYLNSGWKYLTSGDKASLYYQYDGAHTFNAAASTGSAGNAITWDAGTTINPYGIGIGGAISASGIGIKFPATQVASSDANTLDDYEEGTWTPAWNTTNSNMSVAYGVQSGSYTKIGRMVYLRGYIKPNSISSQGTGQVVITGLPFAVVEEIGLTVTDGSGLSAYLSSTQSMLTGYGQNTTQLRPGTLGSGGNSYGFNTGSVSTGFFLFTAYYQTS